MGRNGFRFADWRIANSASEGGWLLEELEIARGIGRAGGVSEV
jgi:hypothetical protein